jgi:YesN/AraC family two-component response regulator
VRSIIKLRKYKGEPEKSDFRQAQPVPESKKFDILVVDDEHQIVELLKSFLKKNGYNVLTAFDGREALDLYMKHRTRIVLTDIKMPGMDGLELLKRIKDLDGERVAVIMASGHADIDDAIESLQHGASRYLSKPLRMQELLASLNECSDKLRLIDQRNELMANLEINVKKRTQELENARSEILKNKDYLQSILDCIAEPVNVMDKDYNIIFANRASLAFSDGDSLEPGSKCYRVFHRRERPCPEEPGTDYVCPIKEVSETGKLTSCVHTHIRQNGMERQVELVISPIMDESGNVVQIIETCRDITERVKLQEDRERLILELQEALSKVKTLSGLLPICAWCKKIRDDKGYWDKLEEYIEKHSTAKFSHGICPDCMKEHFKETGEQ